MNEIKTSCAPADNQQISWDSLDWLKCELAIKKLQARIVKAQKEGRHGKVKALQWTLTHSFYAKALAVRRVTSNSGSKTAGVDLVTWEDSKTKFQAIGMLKRGGYQPQPLRRIHIKKSNGKLRPLGIPTMRDRAMQALYLMALEPVAETTADTRSYGFRRERCTMDAVQQCHNVLRKGYSPEWILEGDIKGCFDHISHEWLLNNIPMDKVMLRKWLECGFVFNKQLFPTEEGTPQGGIISPTLANMALDGLQKILSDKYKRRSIKGKLYSPMVNLIRYADDFIITSENREVLETEIKPLVAEFLAERGLTLSEEKTMITNINDGFDFLGFNIRKFKNQILTKPSKPAQKRFLAKVRTTIKSNKACRQESLIRLLNPMITGWGNYYKHGATRDAFHLADNQIYNALWQWAKRRHSKKGKRWVADKYWHVSKGKGWHFASYFKKSNGKQDSLKLKLLSNICFAQYTQIKGGANPFDPECDKYFDQRETQKMLVTLKGRNSLLYLWKKQDRKCPLCGIPIDRVLPWNVTEKVVNGKIQRSLVHDKCYKQFRKQQN
ncbi:MAG: group II intron reverse transcriptase/maturase [Parachlamydiaceae bacterium]